MIILVGIPGSGKTTILEEVKRAVTDLQIVNYGDQMLKESGLKDRDQLRKMSSEKQKAIGLAAARKIVSKSNGKTLVDTHALIRIEGGYCPGLPREVLEILSPTVCAIVECPPSIIIQRRKQDHSKRKRDIETEEELLNHQELSRTYLCACCMWTGALFCRIDNHSGSTAQNALPLIRMIG